MNTLYDLVKRIDALTANSQQVLNALIRSCIATGSSSGYTVRKFGKDLTLDRAGIYKLYDFYNSWENAQFPSDNRFDALLDKANTRWHKGKDDQSTPVTEVVATHAKILYMTEANQNESDDTYWTNKIKESASGKSVVSTAPIPINLRTPLYDENLSVKSFNQYETYLFPMGYRRTEILGTPGNGEDYVAGGNSWEIGVTDFLRLTSDRHITLGQIPTNDIILDNYGNSRGTLSWGYHSYAFGNNSMAAGTNAIALAVGSFSIGNKTVSYGDYSFACGMGAYSTGRSSIALSTGTHSGGYDSLAANYHSVTGCYPYGFTVKTSIINTSDLQTTCGGVVLTSDECHVDTITTPATSIVKNVKTLLIRIPKSHADIIPFDIRVSDKVRIYGMIGDASGVIKYPGDDGAYNHYAMYTTVTAVSDNINDSYIEYEIQIRDALPQSKWMTSYSGYIQVIGRGTYESYGENSVALNESTWAIGRSQTVVGTSNVPDEHARFVVGTGSMNPMAASIDTEVGSERHRANGLAIAPKYGYMKLYDGTCGFSVSNSNDIIDNYQLLPGAVMRYGKADALHNRAESTETHSLLMSVSDSVPTAMIGTANQADTLFCEYNGMTALKPSSNVSALVRSNSGMAIIASGYSAKDLGQTIYSDWFSPALPQPDNYRFGDQNDVGIYATGVISLQTPYTDSLSNIQVSTGGTLFLNFNELKLQGSTFGTLAATSEARSFLIDSEEVTSPYWGETVQHSGFYFGELHRSGKVYRRNGINVVGYNNMESDQKVHLICSTLKNPINRELVSRGTDNTFNTVALVLQSGIVGTSPFTEESSAKLWNPRVTSVRYRNQWDPNPDVMYSHEIALMDNLYQMCPMSYGHAAAYGYDYGSDAYDALDNNRRNLVPVATAMLSSSMDCKIPVNYIGTDNKKKYYYHDWNRDGSDKGSGPVLRFNDVYNDCAASFNIYSKNDRPSGIEANLMLMVRDFTYSIVGRRLTISFYFYNNAYGVGGYVIPVYLGCAVDEQDGVTNPELYNTDWSIPQATGLNGYWTVAHLYNEKRKRDENNRIHLDEEFISYGRSSLARGTAFGNGLVICEFRTSLTDDGDVTSLPSYTWCHVVLEGIAPFIPKPESCGMTMNTKWHDAMGTHYCTGNNAFNLPELYDLMPKWSSILS